MKPDVLLAALESAAHDLGVKVSYESLGTNVGLGGLCRVKSEYRVIVDKRAGVGERVATLATALGELDTNGVELAAEVREALDRYSARKAS